MPNQHHIDKICVRVWVPRTLYARLRKAAAARRMSTAELIAHLYEKAAKDEVLSPEDYQRIAAETRAAQLRIDRRFGANAPKGSGGTESGTGPSSAPATRSGAHSTADSPRNGTKARPAGRPHGSKQ